MGDSVCQPFLVGVLMGCEEGNFSCLFFKEPSSHDVAVLLFSLFSPLGFNRIYFSPYNQSMVLGHWANIIMTNLYMYNSNSWTGGFRYGYTSIISFKVKVHCTLWQIIRIPITVLLLLFTQVTTIFTESTAGLNVNTKQWQTLDSKQQQAQATVMETSTEWQQLHLRVHMFTACAVINLQVLPDKLNPLVRPLMESIKREENALIQGYAASFIAKLLQQCASRSPCPNPKIIKNLCASACADSSVTPLSACPVPLTQDAAEGNSCWNSVISVAFHANLLLFTF